MEIDRKKEKSLLPKEPSSFSEEAINLCYSVEMSWKVEKREIRLVLTSPI